MFDLNYNVLCLCLVRAGCLSSRFYSIIPWESYSTFVLRLAYLFFYSQICPAFRNEQTSVRYRSENVRNNFIRCAPTRKMFFTDTCACHLQCCPDTSDGRARRCRLSVKRTETVRVSGNIAITSARRPTMNTRTYSGDDGVSRRRKKPKLL